MIVFLPSYFLSLYLSSVSRVKSCRVHPFSWLFRLVSSSIPYMYSMTQSVYFNRMIDKPTWEYTKDICVYLYTVIAASGYPMISGKIITIWQMLRSILPFIFQCLILSFIPFAKKFTIHEPKIPQIFCCWKLRWFTKFVWKHLDESRLHVFNLWWNILKIEIVSRS